MDEVKKTVRAYSIFDIAKWQTELQENLPDDQQRGTEELITLPTLQRGFIWKPYQMEALWDSILRGYPIGALLLSKSGKRKDLLDGQQRCTTIALGFQDPFKDVKEVLNLKKNVPSIWIDLQPIERNKYGLRFGVRVLTRSHPWGYQLTDHRRPIPTGQRQKALEYLRMRCGNQTCGFSQITSKFRTPWDAHVPVPLFMLLEADSTTLDKWCDEMRGSMSSLLVGVETRYGEVSYDEVEESWLCDAYNAIIAAKGLLLPEITVNKKVMAEDENLSNSEEDATLFVRLNAEGTRISGQELIYSMLKAVFPEAKELVEEIDLRFIAPSKLVNLFIRLVLFQQNDSLTYQREVPLTVFRRHLKDDSFKNDLIELIKSGDAKCLTVRANAIISDHPFDLPKIFIREMISGTPDLFLVLLTYLSLNQQVNNAEKTAIRSFFLHVFLFGHKKDKLAAELFKELAERQFADWKYCMTEVVKKKPNLILFKLSPKDFETMLMGKVMPLCIMDGRHFRDEDMIRQILREDDEIRSKLLPKQLSYDDNEGGRLEGEVEQAASYWIGLCNSIFSNKQFLVIAQREYFNREFGEYMEFEGIEDTSRPWDWDHIYPNSWVYKRHNISKLVKRLVNTIGNYRALSFNANRSESNHQSPKTRFQGDEEEKKAYRKDSFIMESDLEHWLELTDADRKLLNTNPEKVNHFVKAVFKRINNIYQDCYVVIAEKTEIN